MNTTTEMLTQDQINQLQQINRAIAQAKDELAQILARKIERLHCELDKAEAELATLDPRIFTKNQHLFTLTFPHGERTLLTVFGAPTQYHARSLAQSGFTHCSYEITEGDQTNGQAVGFYSWYGVAAQEQYSSLAERKERDRS